MRVMQMIRLRRVRIPRQGLWLRPTELDFELLGVLFLVWQRTTSAEALI